PLAQRRPRTGRRGAGFGTEGCSRDGRPSRRRARSARPPSAVRCASPRALAEPSHRAICDGPGGHKLWSDRLGHLIDNGLRGAVTTKQEGRAMDATSTAPIDSLADADGHVIEPGDLWVERLPPDLRPLAPHYYRDEQGVFHSKIYGIDISNREVMHGGIRAADMLENMGLACAMGVPLERVFARSDGERHTIIDAPAWARDGRARLDFNLSNGVSRAVLYPTLMLAGGTFLPHVAPAVCAAGAAPRAAPDSVAGQGRVGRGGGTAGAGSRSGEERGGRGGCSRRRDGAREVRGGGARRGRGAQSMNTGAGPRSLLVL